MTVLEEKRDDNKHHRVDMWIKIRCVDKEPGATLEGWVNKLAISHGMKASSSCPNPSQFPGTRSLLPHA